MEVLLSHGGIFLPELQQIVVQTNGIREASLAITFQAQNTGEDLNDRVLIG